jgi:lipopolysaccharide/colanic/teichoic acid biosynthesis glycosyltransferase
MHCVVGRIKFIFWRCGFWIIFKSKKIGLLGPHDPILFSERFGFRKPIFKIYKFRLFFEPNTPIQRPAADGDLDEPAAYRSP